MLKEGITVILCVAGLFVAMLTPENQPRKFAQTESIAQSHSERNSLEKIYSDESHCLRGPEIRGDKDMPISCYCRDALVDVRYVYQNYILTGKDDNLTGATLSLEAHAKEMCGNDSFLAAEKDHWQWSGPEVMRTCPPDSEINKVKPDDRGWRTLKCEVRLTYRDPQGGIMNVEKFTPLEHFPPIWGAPAYRQEGYIVASAECPTHLGAAVYKRADRSSAVLATIPRGIAIVVTKPYLETDQFYFVVGVSTNETIAAAGYVLKDCVILKAATKPPLAK